MKTLPEAHLVPVRLPELRAGSQPLRVSAWFVEPGDEVVEGDRIVEVLLPGITCDVETPVAGRVVRQERMLDEIVVPGDVLAWLIPSTMSSPDSTAPGSGNANGS